MMEVLQKKLDGTDDNNSELADGERMIEEQPFTDEEIREAFNIFDVNGSDLVSAPEIKFVLEILKIQASDEVI